jgi:hypothetical protein
VYFAHNGDDGHIPPNPTYLDGVSQIVSWAVLDCDLLLPIFQVDTGLTQHAWSYEAIFISCSFAHITDLVGKTLLRSETMSTPRFIAWLQ